jgi:hypothetical protein
MGMSRVLQRKTQVYYYKIRRRCEFLIKKFHGHSREINGRRSGKRVPVITL